jgi:hypothetical protein
MMGRWRLLASSRPSPDRMWHDVFSRLDGAFAQDGAAVQLNCAPLPSTAGKTARLAPRRVRRGPSCLRALAQGCDASAST